MFFPREERADVTNAQLRSYFTSVFVSLGVFLFGYDQGVMSGIITSVISPGPTGLKQLPLLPGPTTMNPSD